MQLSATWPGIVILVLLVCTVIGGAATAFVRLTDKNTPVDIGLLHGRMRVAGTLLLLILLIVGSEFNQTIKPALGLFIITAAGGAALYFIIRRKGILPKAIIFGHGALAITALAVLLFGLPV